jgi:hypothetical protein
MKRKKSCKLSCSVGIESAVSTCGVVRNHNSVGSEHFVVFIMRTQRKKQFTFVTTSSGVVMHGIKIDVNLRFVTM